MTAKRVYMDYLEDILRETQRVEEFSHGLDEQAFRNDTRTVYAITRALEVIGEAAKGIPPEVRARHTRGDASPAEARACWLHDKAEPIRDATPFPRSINRAYP